MSIKADNNINEFISSFDSDNINNIFNNESNISYNKTYNKTNDNKTYLNKNKIENKQNIYCRGNKLKKINSFSTRKKGDNINDNI